MKKIKKIIKWYREWYKTGNNQVKSKVGKIYQRNKKNISRAINSSKNIWKEMAVYHHLISTNQKDQ